MDQTVSIYGIGVSHKNAPLEDREWLALSVAGQTRLLMQVAAGTLAGVTELAILSTCNRVEFYAQCSREDGCTSILEWWSRETGVARDAVERLSVIREGESAVRHLFAVSAGLESPVIGESEILGQVADAYELARGCGATGAILAALLQTAITVGKRVRSETVLGHGSRSISSVAATHARQLFGDVSHLTALVIGAGHMARGVVAALGRQAVGQVMIANHNDDHAEQMAADVGGAVVPYEQLGGALRRADLVITAVSAPQPILKVADLVLVVAARMGRPLVVYDIGMPRNVEPGIGGLPCVWLYTLDDLQQITEAHQADREAAIPEAARIVQEAVREFLGWHAARSVVTTIQGIHTQAEAIREAELSRALGRLSTLDADSRAVIEAFSKRLVNKLLHAPTLTLKDKSGSDEGADYARIARTLFGLDESES